jgi:hypothetical protein
LLLYLRAHLPHFIKEGVMDELDFDELLTEHAVFDEPGWQGFALVHSLLSLDLEQRGLQLAAWRALARAGHPLARTALEAADRFVLGLHVALQRALYGAD